MRGAGGIEGGDGGGGGGAVDSFNARTGAVVPVAGDYSSTQISDGTFTTVALGLAAKVNASGGTLTNGTLAGPTVTGTLAASGATAVTVPTAAPGDSSTKAASTAFVQSALAAPQASGQWTWDATPKTALTLTLAQGESIAIWVFVNVTYYRSATTSYASSLLRLFASGRRAIGGSAAVSTAPTLNAGIATTPTIAAAASGNDVNINVGLGLPTGEGVVVYYDVRYDLIRRTITYP